MPHDFVVYGFSRLHQLVRDPVRLRQVRPQRDEHLTHRGFSGGDSAGQANFQHESRMIVE